jgi:hypothetical protein
MIRDAARAFVLLVILLYGFAVVQEMGEANESNFNTWSQE